MVEMNKSKPVYDMIIKRLSKVQLSMHTSRIQIARDSSLPITVAIKLLFGVKRFVLSYGWQGSDRRVYTQSKSLSIDTHMVVSAHAHDQQIDVSFARHYQERLKDDARD